MVLSECPELGQALQAQLLEIFPFPFLISAGSWDCSYSLLRCGTEAELDLWD